MSIDSALSAPRPLLASSLSGLVITYALTAPAPTLAAAMVGSTVITAALNAPVPQLTSTLVGTTLITAALRAGRPQLSAAIISGNMFAAALIAPAPALTAAIRAGNVLAAALTAPAPTLSALLYSAYAMSAALTAPAPRLESFLSSPVVQAFRSWVLNMRKGALTEYGPEFAFNSFALFNGQVLGCTSNGVVVLGEQADDNGTAIDAVVRTGKSNYGNSMLKRVPRLYIDFESDGDLVFRTITSETGTRSYLLPYNHVQGITQRRCPVGRGPKSVYWQYEFENSDGADFTVQAVLAYPINLRRRIM